METKPDTAVLILPGLKSLVFGIVGHLQIYCSAEGVESWLSEIPGITFSLIIFLENN
jgi:hypothetical protein